VKITLVSINIKLSVSKLLKSLLFKSYSCVSKIYYCISKSHYACWDYTLRVKISLRYNNNLVCVSKPHSWVLKSHYECLNHTQSVEATTLSVTKSHWCMCTFFMGFSGFFEGFSSRIFRCCFFREFFLIFFMVFAGFLRVFWGQLLKTSSHILQYIRDLAESTSLTII
jgi:hypothetical protein